MDSSTTGTTGRATPTTSCGARCIDPEAVRRGRAAGRRARARRRARPSSSTAARDLGTIQTYVAHGGHGAGDAVGAARPAARARATSTSATPTAATRPRSAYAEQARTLRDALLAADTVLAVWRAPLADLAEAARRRRPLGRARRPRCPPTG